MITVREYISSDIDDMLKIWNEIVLEGEAFPQEETLTRDNAEEFFCAQSRTAVAVMEEKVVGLYILHPNNVGRCGHIANASYAVSSSFRGMHIGEALVRDSLRSSPMYDFSPLQFNAVVSSNLPAISLYKKLGFTQLGTIPRGFRRKDGSYADIIPHYIATVSSTD